MCHHTPLPGNAQDIQTLPPQPVLQMEQKRNVDNGGWRGYSDTLAHCSHLLSRYKRWEVEYSPTNPLTEETTSQMAYPE